MSATIRHAAAGDWPRVGELAERLVALHHEFDASRFLHPDRLRAETYTAHVREEIDRGRAAVLVADEGTRIVGYAFAGIEPESWKEFRPEAGYIHDLFVDETHRAGGTGQALVRAAIDWLKSRGARRVMLWAAQKNTNAQRLFERTGFRRTMLEMTLDV
jgi:GNAT superfamily N-acetyltransferase